MNLRRVALIAALCITAAGCGGAKKTTGTAPSPAGARKVSAAEWMAGICTALDRWEKPVTDVPKTADESNLPQVKTTMVRFLDSLVSATDELVGEIQDAGVPDIPNGSEAARDFKAAFIGMETSFKNAKAKIEAAPSDDKAKFGGGLAEVGATLRSGVESAGKAFDEISRKYPELAEATKKAPACGSSS